MKTNNIDKTKHYFILMHPLECFGIFCFTSSTTREKWVECEIVEDRYKVADGYKVTLKSIEAGYGKETFYQSDFKSLLNSGDILEKTSENQYVKEITWIEPLCGLAYLKHSAYVVMNDERDVINEYRQYCKRNKLEENYRTASIWCAVYLKRNTEINNERISRIFNYLNKKN